MRTAERAVFVALMFGGVAVLVGGAAAFLEGVAADSESRGGWVLHWYMLPMAIVGLVIIVASAVTLLTLRFNRSKSSATP